LARQIAALIRQVRQSTPKKEQSSNE
jgi:hypothetical protein